MAVLAFGGAGVKLLPEPYTISLNTAVNEACPWLEVERNFLCKEDKECESLPFPFFRGTDRVNYERTGRINYIVETVMAEIMYECSTEKTKEERMDCTQGVMKSYHEKFCSRPNPCWRKEDGCQFLDFSGKSLGRSTDPVGEGESG